MNMVEGTLAEIDRVREIIKLYKSLPNNAGFIGVSMMEVDIEMAEKALGSGDVVRIVQAYNRLKEISE